MSSVPEYHHATYPDFHTLFEDSPEIQYVLDVDHEFNLYFSAINKALGFLSSLLNLRLEHS